MTGQLWFDNSTQNAASGEATYFSVSGAEGVFDSDDLFEYGLATVIEGVRKRLVP
jgi:hypothetical protein